MSILGPWLYWAVGVAIGLPASLILLTEWQQTLVHRHSPLARPIGLIRNYLLPLGALLVVLVEVAGIPAEDVWVRVIFTVLGFVTLVLLLAGLNVTLFQGAPQGSWRSRVPSIFIDVGRLVLIGVGLTLIFSRIWGAQIGGLFAALGVTSVVIGLMLQNSVGQIVSGLFMLFEQPFRIGDWLDTPTARGRVVEVNWRAVHVETARGLQITPNSVLASTSFTNVSRSTTAYRVVLTTTFAATDPPDRVRALLSGVAAALPQRIRSTGDAQDTQDTREAQDAQDAEDGASQAAESVSVGGGEYRTTIALRSPADEAVAQSTFLRWLWYAARREGLHLDGADEEFSTPERVAEALRTVVGPALRLTDADQRALAPHARLIRYGAGEFAEHAGHVPSRMVFLTAGEIRMTATADDGSVVQVATLQEGAFLGVTALTRQPNVTDAYALSEVTALSIGREHIEGLLMHRPLLLRDLGRIIDERRSKVLQAKV